MFKSLGFIFRAVRNKKTELLLSLAMVLILLVVASVLMYFIEKEAQPEAFSDVFSTMWWGVATLTTVGYGDMYPITVLGKLLGGIIAILGVGLFALPAGIIASGFVEEIEHEKKLKELIAVETKLKHAFSVEYFVPVRERKAALGLGHLPRKWLSVNDIKYKMGIAESILLDVIAFSRLFRLRNVKFSGKDIAGLEYVDSNTVYGTFLDRQSNITLLNLHASIQPFFGHFSNGVADVLQANYISNEVFSALSFLEDEQLNLINNPAYLQHQDKHPALSILQRDIQATLKQGQYCVLLVNAIKDDTLFQLNTGAAVGSSIVGPFFNNSAALHRLHKAMVEVAAKHEMQVLTHQKFGIPDEEHISWWIHQNTGCNLILLHVNVGILKKKLFDYYQYIVDLADCLAQLDDVKTPLN
jgi:hypothetical protein